jgi:hypothetical protein
MKNNKRQVSRKANEYDSDFEADKKHEKAQKTAKMLNAHAELLNFFANISSDGEDSEADSTAEHTLMMQQHGLDPNNGLENSGVEKQSRHEFMRKKKGMIDIKRLNDLNQSKRIAYKNQRSVVSGGSQVNGSLAPQSSYKYLMQMMTQDEEGNPVEPTIEDFRIQRVLGSGAYATVKLATHERSKRRVALKIYPVSKLFDSLKQKSVE